MLHDNTSNKLFGEGFVLSVLYTEHFEDHYSAVKFQPTLSFLPFRSGVSKWSDLTCLWLNATKHNFQGPRRGRGPTTFLKTIYIKDY